MTSGDVGPIPSTWFLPGARAAPEVLESQVARAAASPLVDALLRAWSGAVAVLNGDRQIVALNATSLDVLGVDDPAAVLGLRLGEAIGCDRAQDHPGGCGTGRACAGCGAALSILAAMARDRPEERDCVLTVRRGGEPQDLAFRARASPLELAGERLVVLALADVSAERRRAALERAFVHDLADLVVGLSGACASLGERTPGALPEATGELQALCTRLVREVQVQRALISARPGHLPVTLERVSAEALLDPLRALFAHHPAAAGKCLRVAPAPAGLTLETDPFLLQRVLTNMLVNAFEAAPARGEVRLEVAPAPGGARFQVWNAGAIPAAAATRVFQRFFSTKAESGRGHGTFVMRLFGERCLGGRISFTSTLEGGTTFTLEVPLAFSGAERAPLHPAA